MIKSLNLGRYMHHVVNLYSMYIIKGIFKVKLLSDWQPKQIGKKTKQQVLDTSKNMYTSIQSDISSISATKQAM